MNYPDCLVIGLLLDMGEDIFETCFCSSLTSRDSSVGTVTRRRLNDPGIRQEIFTYPGGLAG
jgi:hypothetical protein